MEPLNDPREVRKLFRKIRYTDSRLDREPCGKSTINAAGALIHHVMRLAEAAGYSGEDAMTMLAYHALLQNEKLMDKQLELLYKDTPWNK